MLTEAKRGPLARCPGIATCPAAGHRTLSILRRSWNVPLAWPRREGGRHWPFLFGPQVMEWPSRSGRSMGRLETKTAKLAQEEGPSSDSLMLVFQGTSDDHLLSVFASAAEPYYAVVATVDSPERRAVLWACRKYKWRPYFSRNLLVTSWMVRTWQPYK